MARAGALGVLIVARDLEPGVPLLDASAWLLALAVPALALAFLVGLLRWRLFAERALQRLAECLRELPDASTLRQGVRRRVRRPDDRDRLPRERRGRALDRLPRPAGDPPRPRQPAEPSARCPAAAR